MRPYVQYDSVHSFSYPLFNSRGLVSGSVIPRWHMQLKLLRGVFSSCSSGVIVIAVVPIVIAVNLNKRRLVAGLFVNVVVYRCGIISTRRCHRLERGPHRATPLPIHEDQLGVCLQFRRPRHPLRRRLHQRHVQRRRVLEDGRELHGPEGLRLRYILVKTLKLQCMYEQRTAQ